MSKRTLISALVLATICGAAVQAQACGFSCGWSFGVPCCVANLWPGFFLSGTHLGLGPGYPGLVPAWSPYESFGKELSVIWPPSWAPPVTAVILHIPHYGVTVQASSPEDRRSQVEPSETKNRWEAAHGRESRRPVLELDTDLEHPSGPGGYSARLYYRGKFYSASETTNREILSSGITLWQRND